MILQEPLWYLGRRGKALGRQEARFQRARPHHQDAEEQMEELGRPWWKLEDEEMSISGEVRSRGGDDIPWSLWLYCVMIKSILRSGSDNVLILWWSSYDQLLNRTHTWISDIWKSAIVDGSLLLSWCWGESISSTYASWWAISRRVPRSRLTLPLWSSIIPSNKTQTVGIVLTSLWAQIRALLKM